MLPNERSTAGLCVDTCEAAAAAVLLGDAETGAVSLFVVVP